MLITPIMASLRPYCNSRIAVKKYARTGGDHTIGDARSPILCEGLQPVPLKNRSRP